jgi:hypothetical protein
LYSQAGVLIPFSISPNATVYSETEDGNIITIDEVQVLPDFKEPLAISASIGAEMNIFSKSRGFIEANYSYGIKTYDLINDKIDFIFQSVRLSLGLRF